MLRFLQCLLQLIGLDKRYRGLLTDFVKKKFIPLDESYNIISKYAESMKKTGGAKEREIREALAIVSKKQGESERAIDLYVQVLIDLSHAEVVSALYISNGEVPFEDTTN